MDSEYDDLYVRIFLFQINKNLIDIRGLCVDLVRSYFAMNNMYK